MIIQKDVIFSNGMRASYKFDQVAKKFETVPFEILKKDRKRDINIVKGSDQSRTFKSDLRISFNYEKKLENSALNEKGVTQQKIRVKKRHSFVIGWTRIDLTEVDNCQ